MRDQKGEELFEVLQKTKVFKPEFVSASNMLKLGCMMNRHVPHHLQMFRPDNVWPHLFGPCKFASLKVQICRLLQPPPCLGILLGWLTGPGGTSDVDVWVSIVDDGQTRKSSKRRQTVAKVYEKRLRHSCTSELAELDQLVLVDSS